MYYVYEWFIVDTKEVIYVGKGCKNRYKVRKHNQLFNEMIKRFYCESRIVKYFEKEHEAFDYEYELIMEMKRKGQCVCNIYDGGFGGTRSCWNEEKRKYYSEHNVMKSQKQRERMSKENPMKNPKIAEKVSKKNSKTIVIDGIEYKGIKKASEKYGISYSNMAYWISRGYTNDLKFCYYKEDGQKVFEIKKRSFDNCKVVYNGKIYNTQKELSNYLKIPTSTLSNYIKRGFTPDGKECRKLNDNSNKEFVEMSNKKKIIFDGIEYDSIKEAEEKNELPKGSLKYALKHSGVYKGKQCEYANQKPIRAKSNICSTEGSETNE